MKYLFFLFFATISLAQTPKFKAQVIDNQIAIGYGMAIGDVDGDKKPDILLADQKEIVWYRNGDWKRFVMAANLTKQDNVCIAARDLDNDGMVEVAVGAQWNPAETKDSTKSGAVFYLIRPKDPTQRWEPVAILPHEVTTHRMKWVKIAADQYQLIVVPLHGQGNQNGTGQGVNIWAYTFPKNPKSTWVRELVDSTMHLTHNLDFFEVPKQEQDKQGVEPHVLIGGKEGIKMLKRTNKGWETVQWLIKDHGIGELRYGFNEKSMFFATVEPMHGNQLVAYRDFEGFPAKSFKRDTLSTKMSQGHALICADFLGQGQSQIVVGWRNPNADKKVGVRLFVPKGADWQEFVLDDSVMMACEDLQAADLNGDGKLDLVASGRATLNLIIYWNQSE